MTAPQNGPQEGQHSTGGGSGAGNGSEGASGAQGAGNEGHEGTEGGSLTYSDVLSALSDDQRAAIVAEVSKKNSEARQQRQRAKAAEEKLANGAAGDAGSGASGQNGGQQQPPEGQQNGQQQRPQEGTQTAAQLAQARVAIARSKVEAIAATVGFADPEDAAALLGDLTSYVDTDFSVDSDAIRSDVDELLQKKPHLKRAQEATQGGGRPGRPAPDRSQGSSANGSGQKRAGTVDAGADLYRSRHARRAATT